MSTDILSHFSKHRSQIIEDIVTIIKEVEQLNIEMGTANEDQLKDFASWIDLVTSDNIRLAVVGEYSNGKSSLLNALLETEILPTALESTTAINTRMEGLHPEHGSCIALVYNNGETKFLPFEVSSIKQFGSELIDEGLSAEERQQRKEDVNEYKYELVEIVVHSPHPLFQNKVVLYDTPGIGSTSKLHDNITARAIHKAHVALWLQKANQLGGTSTEWKFFADKISKNFSNFITVVNKWDHVLAPPKRECKGSYEANHQAKLAIVQEKFQEQAGSLFSSSDLQRLLDEDHFTTTSAIWYEDEDPIKRKWSNIDRLREMIVALCKEEEGKGMVTPLVSVMTRIEENLQSVSEQRDNILSDDSQEKREMEIQKFTLELKDFEQELQHKVFEAKEEHTRNSALHKSQIKQKVLDVLVQLRNTLELELTEEYIRRCIERKQEDIGLPPELQRRMDKDIRTTEKAWDQEKKAIQQTLGQLREGFEADIQDMVQDVKTYLAETNLETMSFEMPTLTIDFSELENSQQELEMLQQSIHEREELIADLQAKKDTIVDEHEEYLAEVEERKRETTYLRDKIDSTPRPEAHVYTEPVPGKSGWGGRPPSTRTRRDDSNVREYEQKVAEWKRQKELAEEAYKQAQVEGKLTKQQMRALDRQRDNAVTKFKRIQRELERKQELFQRSHEQAIKDTFRRLHNQSIGTLTSRIEALEQFVEEAIDLAFETHLDRMTEEVHKRFLNKSKEKKQALEQVQQILQEGQQQVELYLKKLDNLERNLQAQLQMATQLKEIEIPSLFAKEDI